MKMFTDQEIMENLCGNDIDFFNSNLQRIGINYRLKQESNNTLLLFSISDGGSEIYKWLLKNNANIYDKNDLGEGILHAVIYSGKIERLKEVLKFKEIDINMQDMEGVTPLLLSIYLEKYEFSKYLITKGANVNIPDNENNYPIHPASSFGNLEIIDTLVNLGAKINIKNSNGNYPVALAINNDHKEVAKFLLPIWLKG